MKKIRLFLVLILLLINSVSYSQIIISQYYEGANNNKWIELTNIGTDRDMAANPISLMLISGSSAKDVTASSPSHICTFNTGTWISGTSKLVKHGSAVLPEGLTADVSTNQLAFNGTYDVVFLSTSAVTEYPTSWNARVDVVGEVTSNLTTNNDIHDISLVRNASVLSANGVYTASEWTTFTNSQVDNASGLVTEKLGVHIFGTTPNIALLPTSLSGFSYNIGEGPSTEQSFQVSGTNLTEGITLTAPANYEISLETGTNFGTSKSLTQTGGTVSATQIFVRLKSGLSAAVYNENITISSTGATTRSLNCAGQVFDPLTPVALPYLRDFETGDATTDFWSNKAVTTTHQWVINSLSGNDFIQMSNFTNPVYDNAEAWFVSPPFDVVGKDLVVFQFDYAVYELANGHLSVLISNNYDGTSDPSVQGTWADITPTFTVDNYNTFTNTNEIDITSYSTAPVTIAFKFSDASNTDEGNTWRIDNISVKAPITLAITNPNTPTITDLTPQIEFNVFNFSLSPEGTSTGDGYIQYSITDDGTLGAVSSIYTTDPIQMNCVQNHEYKVKMWLVDNLGNSLIPAVKDSVTFTVTSPSATVSATPGCGTGSVTVSSNFSGTQTFYLRDNNGGAISNWTGDATSHAFTGLANGTYKGQVEKDGNISVLSSAVTLTNLTNPVAPTSVQATQTEICNGSSTTLSYTNGSGATFKWYTGSCGGTSAGTGNNVPVSPTDTTTYYGRWENTCGVSACLDITINVSSLITANAGSDAQICVNNYTLNGNNPTPGTGTWQILGGTANITNANLYNSSIIITSSPVTLSWTIVNGTCNSSDQVTITQLDSTSITTQPANLSVNTGGTATFTVEAVGDNLTYQWKKDDVDIAGAVQSTYQISSVTQANQGVYNVVVTGTCGSITSDDATLSVTTSIDNLTDLGINIYPNPSNGVFNISYSGEFENVFVTISDITGKIIYSGIHNSKNKTIDLTTKSAGVYFIKIQTENKILTTKIIKK